MPTLADSLVSSSARPLGIRRRPDLVVNKSRYQGRQFWIVKDPIGLNYFRFQEEEFAILNWLDGLASLDDLRHKFEKQFAPQKIALEELGRLIGMLHQSGLVIAGVQGQGKQLLKRRGERKWKEFLGALSNILAIRFKGIDPERILTWLAPKVAWFYTKPAGFFFIFCLFIPALSLVLVNFDEFHRRLPGFHQFFGPSNWIWLGIAMGLTKVCHEFGHGTSCKHFGGECHELGVMFLVLTPCLYCNVSDSWMLPNKWHRAMIGAAGMYVEVCIASIATFVWWFSAPGLLNNVALSTMFVCSVSTLVFNGNPLLRYDGYYILSDILEIPNLRQKATTILQRKLGAWCLGLEEPDDPFLPKANQPLFMLYSVAASVYSWVVMFSILFFLFKVFQPYRLQVIGEIIATASIASLIGRPLWSLGKFFYVPGRLEEVKKPRFYISLGVVATVLGLILFLPLPYHVYCSLQVQPRDAEMVYVVVPGELATLNVEPGEHVTKGQALAVLESDELDSQILDTQSKLNQANEQLKSLNRSGIEDPRAFDQIPETLETIHSLQSQLQDKFADKQRLTLVATRDGVVIPPPSHPKQPSSDGRLLEWTGTPLEKKNVGATLKPSTFFCQIGEPGKFDALLVVDQSDIELIREGLKVKIMLDEIPGETQVTEISSISNRDVTYLPKSLSNQSGGAVETKRDPSGMDKPASISYWARAPLDDSDGLLVTGVKGQAKVDADWHSLGWRGWRFLQRTFHFKL
jgi:putative peptide zinc metalloprotease protein